MTQTDRQTAWPEGVTARYLTIAGATVDITGDDYGTHRPNARCGGCPQTFATHSHCITSLAMAHRWAQEHSEKCRALPRPTA
ncbi:hypothetical protein [Streptomyces pacificus]|uniref:Uncharacterized protein n=1 Tax=Streptomyces pacificus TaxID=2705029 RepID=A0A6A0AW72_9ACTN|nr:hypothetical protein [Streptomyces pacificus]GFH36613.1 hypothetical protein SCWH03_28440 [Streptomyces pacificus]